MLNRQAQRASQPRASATRRKPAVPTTTLDAAAAQAGERTAVDMGRLDHTLGYVLRRAQLAVFKSFQQAFRGTDITPAQISVMVVIERNPGLTHTQVADSLGIKRANFVALFEKLESRRFVQRGPSVDRRSQALHLTARGQTLLKRLRTISADFEAKISAPLGPQGRETLFQLLHLMIASLESGADDASADE